MSFVEEAERLAARLSGMWWPAADPDALDRTADVYARARAVIDAARDQAGHAAREVVAASAGSGTAAFADFWQRYDGGGGGWLHDAATACDDIAHALRRFAAVVRQARQRIAEQVATDGAVLLGGVALSWCTFGLSDLAAAAASAAIIAVAEAAGVAVSAVVADVIATLVVSAAIAGLESATVNVTVAQPVEAVFDHRQRIDLGEAFHAAWTGALGGLTGTVIPARLDTVVGRVITGATSSAGLNELTDGRTCILDAVTGGVGGALSAGQRHAEGRGEPR